MAVAKIQKGDKVKVIAGNYKGTTGEIIRIAKKKLMNGLIQTRAAVSNVPMIVKYRAKNRSISAPGQKLEVARLIHVSNLMRIDDSGQTSRVKIQVDPKTHKKSRILKGSQQILTKPVDSAKNKK